ncbi:DUF2378 family protein [Myxococcus sp. K15C18031901]|uniref:DUF2378 family protein n=1 Tax=Myxococcus dinghuensis TaxID=2906761 RepID=UPI0020A7EA13|nr:DUF2378 family protein [Myxococcus dinghuensis]MCP3099740.1 DUF2378 family protein [Myxococcus dinghuensis]
MDAPQHLQARMALCRPEHQVLTLFMQSLHDTIAKRTGRAVTSAPAAGRGAPTHHTALEYLRLLHAGASTLASLLGQSYASAVEQLSFAAAEPIYSAPVGAMVMAITGEDPHRGLAVASGFAEATSTFGERDYERLDDTRARLRFRDELFGPAWTRGMMRRGLVRTSPGRRFHVELESGEAPFKDFTLLVHW